MNNLPIKKQPPNQACQTSFTIFPKYMSMSIMKTLIFTYLPSYEQLLHSYLFLDIQMLMYQML
jgi:hypothetical protein